MAEARLLHELLWRAAEAWPARVALEEEGGGAVTYRDLARLAEGTGEALRGLGVRRGDRVAVCVPKSVDAVAAIFGVMRAGATYLPLDPSAPAERNRAILRDARVRAAVLDRRAADGLSQDLGEAGVLALEDTARGDGLRSALEDRPRTGHPPAEGAEAPQPTDPAYVLYTSGSTGMPKGVMISHTAALSFVGWASQTFLPTSDDCFSSHAPLHFDLSVFDLYVAIRHGARVVLITEATGKEPQRLAALIAGRRISVWYSVPSVLSLLVAYGKLSRWSVPDLRLVLFAGEVFPVVHLRALRSLWPAPRFFNLYGPTETNVCTAFEIPPTIPEDRTRPFPIGRACAHLRTVVVDGSGRPVPAGSEGELCVRGPAVMLGYWNRAEETERAFLETAPGERWYRTGDVVVENAEGEYEFLGRRDRMVKRRGYRVELGEIEAALHRHPAVREAAVIAFVDDVDGIRLKAFLGVSREPRPSPIELKRFCAELVPGYMIPDFFVFAEALPRTSTGKVDYRRLETGEPRGGMAARCSSA
jgi:amino acid adenylation domain-containing protein